MASSLCKHATNSSLDLGIDRTSNSTDCTFGESCRPIGRSPRLGEVCHNDDDWATPGVMHLRHNENFARYMSHLSFRNKHRERRPGRSAHEPPRRYP
jgi:hypothetical protein